MDMERSGDDLDERFAEARAGFAPVALEFALAEGEVEGRGYGRWAAYRSAAHEFVLHLEVGDAPWMTVGPQGGAARNIETLAEERAAALGEKLPARPHRGCHEIVGYLALLCRQYLREELEGRGEVWSPRPAAG